MSSPEREVVTTTELVLYVALQVANVAHFVPASILFFRRRNTFPISGRCVPLVLMSLVSLFAYNTSGNFLFNVLWRAPHCAVLLTFEILPVYFFACGYFARAWRVWFFYLLACEKADRSPGRKRWFTEHRLLLTTRNLLLLPIVVSLLLFSVSLIWFLVEIPNYSADHIAGGGPGVICLILLPAYNLFALFGALMAIFGIWTVYKLRVIKDGFHILWEMKYVGLVGFVSLVGSWVFGNVLFIELPGVLFSWIASQAIFFLGAGPGLTLPAYPSYRYEKQKKDMALNASSQEIPNQAVACVTVSQMKTLHEVLANDDTRVAFMEHLKKEWSVENLLFYQAATEFEERCLQNLWDHDDQRNRRAVEMSFQYIFDSGAAGQPTRPRSGSHPRRAGCVF